MAVANAVATRNKTALTQLLTALMATCCSQADVKGAVQFGYPPDKSLVSVVISDTTDTEKLAASELLRYMSQLYPGSPFIASHHPSA